MKAAQCQATVCSVHALAVCFRHTWLIRRTDQRFVTFHSRILCRPLSNSWLSRCIMEATRQAYASSGLATLWTLRRSARLSTICAVAMWSSRLTFTRFYCLDVTASPCFEECDWISLCGNLCLDDHPVERLAPLRSLHLAGLVDAV